MTQPPLTQQIQRLERDLGAQLFDRSKRRIQLTGAGERLLVESRKLLAQLDRTVDSVQRTARGELGRVTIAYVSSAPYEVLPAIIRAFGRAFPEIGLNLVAMTTSAQVEALNNAEIDIGILRPPIENHAGLVLRIIGSEPLIAAISANHTLADNPSLCLAALANQEFVILPRQQGPGYHDLLLSACRAAGFNPKIVHQASQLPELVGFVAGGLGVALLPSTARHIRLPEVAYRDIEPPSVRLQMAAVWRQELISPQLARLLEVLVEVKPIVDLPSYAADDQVLPNHMVF